VVRQNGLSGVMVSHDLAQAARIGDRVMVMSKGRLEKIGTANEVINAEGTFR
jgi:peptide/nickel transport system ATP-binding protein